MYKYVSVKTIDKKNIIMESMCNISKRGNVLVF